MGLQAAAKSAGFWDQRTVRSPLYSIYTIFAGSHLLDNFISCGVPSALLATISRLVLPKGMFGTLHSRTVPVSLEAVVTTRSTTED